IFYQAPHRIAETLDDIEEVLGARSVVLARELTKLHEEFLHGTPAELKATLNARPSIKGEFTVLIGKAQKPSVDDTPLEEAVAAAERGGLNRMDAIKQVARARGLSKREVYRLLNG